MEELLRLSQISAITNIKRHTLNARVKTALEEHELNRSTGNQILLYPKQTRKIIEDQIISSPGKIIYIGNLKGGVGKTTLSYLLSNTSASLGLKTCILDLDVQANITRQYVNVSVEQPVFVDVINDSKQIQDVIIPISDTLHIIPSSLKNSLIEKTLAVQSPKNYLNWFNSICISYLKNNYDLIVVDTPPHLTTLNSVFCLCLTNNDHLLVPVNAEEFSIMGVEMFLNDIVEIRDSYTMNDDVNISVVMNKFFQTQKTNLEMLVKMGQKYGKMLSEIIIRDNARIREVMNSKTPMGQIKRGKEIYEAISSLLRETKILKGEDHDNIS